VAQISIDDRLGAARGPAPAARTLCSEIIRWEGFRREMYVDARGRIRTGIGHPLPDAGAALALPWQHRAGGRRATASEVRAAYQQVRAQAAGHPAPALQRASDLVLPAGFAADLATAHLERVVLPGVRKLCPTFDRFPLPAQRALIDMAFDLGLDRLALFHNLIAACRRGDFAAAADHCHRPRCQSARNVSTRDLFRDAVVGQNARRDGGRR
jgi:GH24 family phage-related lysozyme (muramidase)